MNKLFTILFITMLLLSSPALGVFCAPSEGAPITADGTNGKILIAYFSRTGNTEKLAVYIQEFTGGDLFRIVTADPYPSDYNECIDQASSELKRNFRPELSSQVEDIAKYSTVYLGYPIWWGHAPMAVRSFLEGYNLDGKTIIPFCTSGSSGIGQSVFAIRELCSDATILDGFHVRGSAVNNAKSDIKSWIDGLTQKMEGAKNAGM